MPRPWEEDDQYDDWGRGPYDDPMPATDGKVGDIATQLGGTNYGAPWAGGEGGGGGGGFAPNGLGARPTFNFPGAPVFKYPKFHAPSQEEAQKEPGYQFRLDAGQQALERSASAKGILRTGGTLKDFVEYGQNFGAAEYNNVFNRALQGYDREYRGAYDAFAPQLADYNNRFRAETASGLAAYDRDWQQYVFANTPHGGGGGGGGPIDPPPEPPDVSAYGNRDDDWKEYEFAA